jgi:nuclear pore complex protein Nup85
VGYVTDIPSVQTLQSRPGFQGLSSHRLEFTIRYAEFQRHRLDRRMQDAAWDIVDMFNDEIPPKSWWAVLLHHAVEYLQCGKVLGVGVTDQLTVTRFRPIIYNCWGV